MPNVSKEEWNEEEMVWLTPRQMMAAAILINEVQLAVRNNQTELPIKSELLEELRGVKSKLWEAVMPLLNADEAERANIDPDLGSG